MMALADRIFPYPLPKSPTSRSRASDALLDRRQRALKRVFDATLASMTLVVMSPLMLLIAILVSISSPGPVIYRHRRVGQGGRAFDVLKYRTMHASAASAEWQITVAGDPRITAIGRWLRSSKLDELPQLWNVLRGEMSLVGWRPHVAGYPDRLSGPDAALIEERPGITGAATLYFRDEERLLSLTDDPKRHYDEVIYPLKVRIGSRLLPDVVAQAGPRASLRHGPAGARWLAQGRAIARGGPAAARSHRAAGRSRGTSPGSLRRDDRRARRRRGQDPISTDVGGSVTIGVREEADEHVPADGLPVTTSPVRDACCALGGPVPAAAPAPVRRPRPRSRGCWRESHARCRACTRAPVPAATIAARSGSWARSCSRHPSETRGRHPDGASRRSVRPKSTARARSCLMIFHIRDANPHLGTHTLAGQQLRFAVELASDVEGLCLVPVSTSGDRYRVKVSEDGSVVGLRRRTSRKKTRRERGTAPDLSGVPSRSADHLAGDRFSSWPRTAPLGNWLLWTLT